MTPATDAALIRVQIGTPSTHLGHIDDAVGSLRGYHDSQTIETERLDGFRRTVYKLGRETRLTKGRVEAVRFEGVVNYRGPMQCTYRNMFTIEGEGNEPFSAPGDSGALIFDEEGYAVALLVGGTQKGGHNNRRITDAFPLIH